MDHTSTELFSSTLRSRSANSARPSALHSSTFSRSSNTYSSLLASEHWSGISSHCICLSVPLPVHLCLYEHLKADLSMSFLTKQSRFSGFRDSTTARGGQSEERHLSASSIGFSCRRATIARIEYAMNPINTVARSSQTTKSINTWPICRLNHESNL